MQKKAYNSEMVRDTALDKCTAAAKESSNFSSEEYGQSFLIKWRSVSLRPTLWWASCYTLLLDEVMAFRVVVFHRIWHGGRRKRF